MTYKIVYAWTKKDSSGNLSPYLPYDGDVLEHFETKEGALAYLAEVAEAKYYLGEEFVLLEVYRVYHD
jgi:hypothetical protein